MLTYVIRRLLYSIVVLFAASFLVFTFVAVSGDPLAPLRITPNISRSRRSRTSPRRKHLDDPIPVRYGYWAEGRDHEPVRHDAAQRQADPARPLARDEEHAPARHRRRAAGDPDRRRDRGLLRVTAVLGVRLQRDDVQLPRARHARVLARAHAPGCRRLRLPVDGSQHLPDREPELGRPRNRGQLLDRPCAPSGAAGARADGRQHRDVLAVSCAPRCSR